MSMWTRPISCGGLPSTGRDGSSSSPVRGGSGSRFRGRLRLDAEGTVDGVHLNDLGSFRVAGYFAPIVAEMLGL